MINHRLINAVLALSCIGLAVTVALHEPKPKPAQRQCAENGVEETQRDGTVVCLDKHGRNAVRMQAKPVNVH